MMSNGAGQVADKKSKSPNVSDLHESLLHREAEIDLLQRTFTEIGSELDPVSYTHLTLPTTLNSWRWRGGGGD